MKIFLLSIILLFTIKLNAQNVNIPDVNFKAYLVGNNSINTNMDLEIQLSEASAFGGIMNCEGLNINDMTGIVEKTDILTTLKRSILTSHFHLPKRTI